MKLQKKQLFLLTIIFLVGMAISIFIFNNQKQDRNSNLEITFIDSRQALVFWKTENKTIGFVKYGEFEKSLDKKVYQTSSEPGKIHAVVLEDIPIEGVYISLHNESDSPFLFSKTQRIFFDSEKYQE